MTTLTARPARPWTIAALLLAAGACIAFGQGRWPVPLAAWLAPILLIRFTRLVPAWVALAGVTVTHALAWEVAYLGMVPMPTAARWGLFTGLSLVFGGVILADRFVARRYAGLWTTLVFPCGWVALEYLNGRFSPSGSWGSIAYTFTDQLALLQVVSLVGWTGITFMVGWVASVINWQWQRGWSDRRAWRGTALCAAVVAAVLLHGGVRLVWPVQSETVRVASIVGPSSYRGDTGFREDVWKYTRGVEQPQDQVAAARAHIEATVRRHLALAERELRAGARVVMFPEANPSITAAEEPAFVEAARRLAEQHGAYVGLGPFVFRPDAGLPSQNKCILLGPGGSAVWDYLKSTRVPGSSHVVGPGTLPNADTPIGRLSCAICFDMDFPRLLHQAGRNATDLFFAPSNDWSEVRFNHARMAIVRAVEQGFSLVRPTKDGITVFTDARGRIIVWQDTDTPGEHAVSAEVPVQGVATLYGRIGDVFSWACMFVFVLLTGGAILKWRRPVGPIEDGAP